VKILQLIILLLSSYWLSAQSTGGDYYVAPPDHPETPGSDLKGDGSFSAPWGSFQKAFLMARPGDTVYFRGGTYYSTEANVINPNYYWGPKGRSGTPENPICYFGYPEDVLNGNLPVLDCQHHCENANPGNYGYIYNSAIKMVNVQFIHFKDLEVKNVFQCDSTIDGAIAAADCANLTFEHVIVHDVGERGYWIQGGAWGEFTTDPPPQFPYDTTRWINCDTYNLCDTLVYNMGNAADAWKTIQYKGNYVSWEGCRAWNYSDDGWDPSAINGATRVFNNCWAMAGEKYINIDPDGDGAERNGFKNFGFGNGEFDPVDYPTIIMTNCVAAFCSNGFGELNYTTNGLYYNNTAYKNEIGFFGFEASEEHPRTSVYRNNISYASIGKDPGLGQPYEVALMGDSYAESHNTWDWKRGYPYFAVTDSVTVTDGDFVELDEDAIYAQLTAPRNPDGSLPDISVLHLVPESDLVDAGIDVGLPYNGSAPDIGAFETRSQKGSGNLYPVIAITAPSNGDIFTVGQDIVIHTNASDADGFISKVEFYDGNLKIGEATSSPWSFTWQDAPVGIHSLKAKAIDNQNAKSTSAVVTLMITPEAEVPGTSLLYPNPNHGIFSLYLPDPPKSDNALRIISLDGKVMYSGTLIENEFIKEFDLTEMRAGFYILWLSSKEYQLYNKFLKL
jgi:hypothetical protein